MRMKQKQIAIAREHLGAMAQVNVSNESRAQLARYCEHRAASYCGGRESHKRLALALAYCTFAIRLRLTMQA